MKQADIRITCDLCLISTLASDLDNRAIIQVGKWFTRKDKDICPRCASTINTALHLGLIEGEPFDFEAE